MRPECRVLHVDALGVVEHGAGLLAPARCGQAFGQRNLHLCQPQTGLVVVHTAQRKRLPQVGFGTL